MKPRGITDRGLKRLARIAARKRKPTKSQLEEQQKSQAMDEAIAAGTIWEYMGELIEQGREEFYGWWWSLDLDVEALDPQDPDREPEIVSIMVDDENYPTYDELVSGEYSDLDWLAATEESASAVIERMEEERLRGDHAADEAEEQARFALQSAKEGEWGYALDAAYRAVSEETNFGVDEPGYYEFQKAMEMLSKKMRTTDG